MVDRQTLRQTFNSASGTYHRARPRYPTVLFDRLVQHTGLAESSKVLEIGPATGVATEELAERCYGITAVELGADLADFAANHLSRFSNVAVVHASFDTWEPPSWGSFDLVFAATAWHWLDPHTKYERAHRHLRDNGYLAFWSAGHVFPDGGDPFFAEIQSVYDEIGEALPNGWVTPRPGELPDLSEEVESCELFEMVAVEHFDWELRYDGEQYIDLLNTFSGHINMSTSQRDRLYGEIRRRLGEREDKPVRRHWGAALHVARRL